METSSPMDCLHHRRTGGEDRGLLGHDAEVGHRRDERAVPGRRPENAADHGDMAGAAGLHAEVDREAAGTVTGRPVSRAFEQHDERHLVGQGELGDPVTLGVAAAADRAGQRGEVLGSHRAPAGRRSSPEPATRASAGTSPPVSVPISRNVPGSRRVSTRARASSLPAPRCLASRSSPPMERLAA